jgi:hypothetical protein
VGKRRIDINTNVNSEQSKIPFPKNMVGMQHDPSEKLQAKSIMLNRVAKPCEESEEKTKTIWNKEVMASGGNIYIYITVLHY